MKKILLVLSLIYGVALFGQNTPGNVDFTITTLPNGNAFSPKHVLAIWVEDASGNFVKTLKLNAATRKQYLYTWNGSSDGNVTDAVTGATLSAHTSHSLTWDCTNVGGEIVPDGEYTIQIEYTSEHAQGPLTSLSFTKSGKPFSLEPADESYFENMLLTYTPPPSPTRAHEINDMLGRGVNLGNGFESPRGENWGISIKEEYLQIIAEKGFSHIRVPIRWNDYASENPPYTIETSFMDTIRKVVDAALENKLLVIINMHHYDDFNDNPNSVHKTRFLAIWSQISEEFKDYPDSLLFEFLNEPHEKMTAADWNNIYQETLDTVRRANPTRICVVGPPDWNGIGSVDKLEWTADTNMIMTVHYYNPFHFTHQGASWVGDVADSWLGTTWDSTQSQMQAVINDFAQAREFSETHHVPVHVGEFGAYEKADWVSRKKWTAYCARTFESFGFSWAYWEFGSGFGVFDPALEIWRNYLLNALTEQIDTNSIPPDPWETRNGGFTNELIGWNFYTQGTAVASAAEKNEEAVFNITVVDGSGWHVQFSQTGIRLIQGGEYRLSYDAWTGGGETAALNAYFGGSDDPYPYYQGKWADLDGNKTKHVFNFSMTEPSDYNARLVFDLGYFPAEIHLDNIIIEQLFVPTLVESIELGPTSPEISVKAGSVQLTANVLPLEANNRQLKWEIVKGNDLAVVSQDGLVTANGTADGEVKITATAVDGSGISASLFVAINNQLLVESIALSPTKTLIDTYKGTARIFYEVLPEGASNKALLWEITQGEDLAEITQDGYFSASGAGDGDVVIKASAKDASGIYSEVTIEVKNQVLVESIEINASSQIIDVLEGTLQLGAAVLPENASRKEIAWSTVEGASKATVDNTGLLKATGHGNGLVIVRASANDGSGVYDEVDVTLSNQGVSVDQDFQHMLKVFIENNTLYYELHPGEQDREVLLLNIDGKVLFKKTIPASTVKGNMKTGTYPKGIYLVVVQDSKGIRSQKVVIL